LFLFARKLVSGQEFVFGQVLLTLGFFGQKLVFEFRSGKALAADLQILPNPAGSRGRLLVI